MDDFLKKLNQIDIKDLLKLDYTQLLKRSKEKPEIVVNIILICLTLVICTRTFTGQRAETAKARDEIPVFTKKIDALKKHNIAEKKLEDFIENIPKKISSLKFTDLITDLAVSRDIKINTFSPVTEKTQKLYTTLTTNMNVTIKNYATLWSFINALEKSPHSIFINKLDARSGSRAGNTRGRSRRKKTTSQKNIDAEIITLQLQIVSVIIRKDE